MIMINRRLLAALVTAIVSGLVLGACTPETTSASRDRPIASGQAGGGPLLVSMPIMDPFAGSWALPESEIRPTSVVVSATIEPNGSMTLVERGYPAMPPLRRVGRSGNEVSFQGPFGGNRMDHCSVQGNGRLVCRATINGQQVGRYTLSRSVSPGG